MDISNYSIPTKKRTAHQVLVDRILEVTKEDPKKKYGYWVKKVSLSTRSMNFILDLCDKADTLDSKYSKGGFIRNRL